MNPCVFEGEYLEHAEIFSAELDRRHLAADVSSKVVVLARGQSEGVNLVEAVSRKGEAPPAGLRPGVLRHLRIGFHFRLPPLA
jgi:hypothetical protein